MTKAEFKEIVLSLRYAFEEYEMEVFAESGIRGRGTPVDRRHNYKQFLKDMGASQEVIEFSLNEFIPLDKEHLELQRQNQLPSHLED